MAVWWSTFATTKISYLHNVILDVWPSLIKPPNLNCLLGSKLLPLQNTGRFFFLIPTDISSYMVFTIKF